MAPARPRLAYTLYVQLVDIHPPIWRRIVVPGNLTLHQLHHVLQVVIGWTHSHLHQFLVSNGSESIYYGEPSPEDEYAPKDDRLVRLAQIAPKKDAQFQYDYDFGDNWHHLVTVEDIEMSLETYLCRVARNCFQSGPARICFLKVPSKRKLFHQSLPSQPSLL